MRRFILLTFMSLLAVLGSEANAQTSDKEFMLFLKNFKDVVRTNHTDKIAGFINFPLYVHSTKYSYEDFINNRDESINFFNEYMRDEIQKLNPDEFVTIDCKKGLANELPECEGIPGNTIVVEADIMRQNGGPAMRLIFAKSGADYKLFCLAQ